MYDENLQEIKSKKIEQSSKQNCLRLELLFLNTLKTAYGSLAKSAFAPDLPPLSIYPLA